MHSPVNTDELNSLELMIFQQFDKFLVAHEYTGVYNPGYATDPPYFMYTGHGNKNKGYEIEIQYVFPGLNVRISKIRHNSRVWNILAYSISVIVIPPIIILALIPGGLWLMTKIGNIRLWPANSFWITNLSASMNPKTELARSLTHNPEHVIKEQLQFIQHYLLRVIDGEDWPEHLPRVNLRS